ncbi:hypothetical protein [Nostoc sp.]|uniref:pPIWI_RE_Z domain-containing protein n=1 Tax=Nostoc sp. TaxID=1180 RepID=UPI002FFC5680
MTLFKPPDILTERLKELKDNSELDREQAQLLLQVELGFALMERLEIDDEPVTAVWAILSGMPLRHPRLQNLDELQRRAVANARQIIPFSARFEWLGALRFYIRNIPQNRRNYDFDIQDLDSQIIHAAKHHPHPHDTQAIAQEINRRALDWIEDANFIAWEGDGILGRAEAVRRLAACYWRSVEHRSYYKTLRANEELRAFPRQDLAATTAGVIVQAVGRLLRGGVLFHAYFVDAAWAPNYAKEQQPDTPRTSLLAAIIDLLCEYVNEDVISQALYQSIADALADIDGFSWEIDARDR